VEVMVEVSHCNYSEAEEEVVVAETDDEEEAEAEIEVVGCRAEAGEHEEMDGGTVDDRCRAPGEEEAADGSCCRGRRMGEEFRDSS